MVRAVRKPHSVQCLKGFLLIRHAVVILGKHHIFNSGQVADQMELLKDQSDLVSADIRECPCVFLRDVHAVQKDLAFGRLVQCSYDVHHRTLARAGRSHDRQPFALLHLEADVIQRMKAAVYF